jgi:hypothetical protein
LSSGELGRVEPLYLIEAVGWLFQLPRIAQNLVFVVTGEEADVVERVIVSG